MKRFYSKGSDTREQEVFPGIVGHLVHTEKLTVADFLLEEGTALPTHQHPHEQISTILEGTFKFTVGEETRICTTGDVVVIPGNTPHSGTAVTECRIIDVFSPARDDYRLE
ncbi:cupin domain-containing protein [Lewinella sp. W8]|uniref:cupin domain-containing protein n=1 Tax=Lewinella sp. W8 TaxID=2528208 RepID=UPI001067B5A1|nr:cupin domain-containing protein [Lewinella sp. W8]MTB53786.1 cupin domain-containing protein [Lewinella sp. W8]